LTNFSIPQPEIARPIGIDSKTLRFQYVELGAIKVPPARGCGDFLAEGPNGTTRGPLPVLERGRRKGRFIKVRCPECRLTTASARPDRINIAWNKAVTEARQVPEGEE